MLRKGVSHFQVCKSNLRHLAYMALRDNRIARRFSNGVLANNSQHANTDVAVSMSEERSHCVKHPLEKPDIAIERLSEKVRLIVASTLEPGERVVWIGQKPSSYTKEFPRC